MGSHRMLRPRSSFDKLRMRSFDKDQEERKPFRSRFTYPLTLSLSKGERRLLQRASERQSARLSPAGTAGSFLGMAKNPADLVLRARLKEAVRFPDLSERLALKLDAVLHYCARAHFGLWHKRIGSPDFSKFDGMFTPLVYVETEVTDVPLEPMTPLQVHGETYLARTLDGQGATRHLVREGHHTLVDAKGNVVARARLMNVFTRYDPDPAKRRVTELPPSLNLGKTPSRLTELPEIETLLPAERSPEFEESAPEYWHYGQTDANRHVNGVEYLRVMQEFAARHLGAGGHDLRHLYFGKARIVYRKPCFRGEGYRRRGWLQGEAPPVLVGAFAKEGDAAGARPAVAIELSVAQHG